MFSIDGQKRIWNNIRSTNYHYIELFSIHCIFFLSLHYYYTQLTAVLYKMKTIENEQ